MKAIKITPKNTEMIETELKLVNGKSREHTYTDYSEIESMAAHAEHRLLEILPKKSFSGAVWVETSGGSVANCYRSLRNGTMVRIERRSSAWYLTDIQAVTLFQEGGGKGNLFLTVAQAEEATRRFRNSFYINKG